MSSDDTMGSNRAAGVAMVVALAVPVLAQSSAGLDVRIDAQTVGGGVAEIGAVELRLLPSSNYRFYAAMTVRKDGGGSWDLLSGELDLGASPPVFVKNSDVDHINGTGDELWVSLSGDGLALAVDTPAGPVYAVRASLDVPFPAPLPVAVPGTDPSFADFGGGEVMVFVRDGALWAAAFDRGAYAEAASPLSNAREILERPRGHRGLRCPRGIVDQEGRTRAVLVVTRAGGRRESSANLWAHAIGLRADSVHGNQVFTVSSVAVSLDEESTTIAVGCLQDPEKPSKKEFMSEAVARVLAGYDPPRDRKQFVRRLPATRGPMIAEPVFMALGELPFEGVGGGGYFVLDVPMFGLASLDIATLLWGVRAPPNLGG